MLRMTWFRRTFLAPYPPDSCNPCHERRGMGSLPLDTAMEKEGLLWSHGNDSLTTSYSGNLLLSSTKSFLGRYRNFSGYSRGWNFPLYTTTKYLSKSSLSLFCSMCLYRGEIYKISLWAIIEPENFLTFGRHKLKTSVFLKSTNALTPISLRHYFQIVARNCFSEPWNKLNSFCGSEMCMISDGRKIIQDLLYRSSLKNWYYCWLIII